MGRRRKRTHVPAFRYLLSLFFLLACAEDEKVHPAESLTLKKSSFATKNVVVVVIDGPRYSETWGMESRPFIPYMATKLAPEGIFFSNFQNQGPTYTLAGHTAITTGHYQPLANDGTEIPLKPSLFQHYLQQSHQSPEKACLVTSKAKLSVLSDSREMDWRGRFNPEVNCGDFVGNSRSDKETLATAIETLQKKQPTLMLVQFLGPDYAGHANKWDAYLQSIQETDSLVFELWQSLQKDPHYKDKTALLVTNDHGRHGNHHKDGFVSHGDGCEHCRHISLLALGPDFKKGLVVDEEYEQIDLFPTIAQLLGISIPEQEGKLILPLLKN